MKIKKLVSLAFASFLALTAFAITPSPFSVEAAETSIRQDSLQRDYRDLKQQFQQLKGSNEELSQTIEQLNANLDKLIIKANQNKSKRGFFEAFFKKVSAAVGTWGLSWILLTSTDTGTDMVTRCEQTVIQVANNIQSGYSLNPQLTVRSTGKSTILSLFGAEKISAYHGEFSAIMSLVPAFLAFVFA